VNHGFNASIVIWFLCIMLACTQAQEPDSDKKAVKVDASDQFALLTNSGKPVIVEGVVVSTLQNQSDGASFLNFSKDPAGFSALIDSAVCSSLKPMQEYEGKKVKVTGELESDEDKFQIRVTRISQIEVDQNVGSAEGEDLIPAGIPVPGKPGFVTSPHSPDGGFIDVRGFPSGAKVRDPYSGKMFLSP
jgi:uncharacterized protein YdeI (BOF family)